VPFSTELTAALSGATMGQLQYWRSDRGDRGPVLVPEYRDGRTWLYSFRDVVALRTVVYLREDKSLQKIRRALETLDDVGEGAHLSEYVLVSTDDGSIVWADASSDSYVDLVNKPGQLREPVVMETVFGRFRDKDGGLVRPLCEPFPHIRISPEVRGGYPVIKDTRVPYVNVATLVRDGVAPRAIRGIYPAVSAAAARDAAAFAAYVDERTQPRRAA